MGHVENFQGLEVWQRAHQLALAVYRVTKSFPDLSGLTHGRCA